MALLLSQLVAGSITGTGALAAQAAVIVGVGLSSSSGTGSLSAGFATIVGVGLSTSLSTSAVLLAQGVVIVGEGTVVGSAYSFYRGRTHREVVMIIKRRPLRKTLMRNN